MSYNPNKLLDPNVCRGIEKLFDSLKAKGIILKGIELSKPLTLFGTKTTTIPLDFGMHYNRRHVKVTVTPRVKKETANATN